MLPLAERQVVVESKFGDQGLDADVEGGELDLAQVAILDETAAEIPQVLGPDAVLVVVLLRRVGEYLYLLAIVTADFFFHIIHTRLIDFQDIARRALNYAHIARREAQLGWVLRQLVRVDLRIDILVRSLRLLPPVFAPRVFSSLARGFQVNSVLVLSVRMFALTRDAAVASFGKLSFLLCHFPCYSMIS